MFATIGVDIETFNVPNFVRRTVAIRGATIAGGESDAISLKELDRDTLSELCDKFRAEVFKKAGKTDPTLIVRGG